jgi:hypothetical protein
MYVGAMCHKDDKCIADSERTPNYMGQEGQTGDQKIRGRGGQVFRKINFLFVSYIFAGLKAYRSSHKYALKSRGY